MTTVAPASIVQDLSSVITTKYEHEHSPVKSPRYMSLKPGDPFYKKLQQIHNGDHLNKSPTTDNYVLYTQYISSEPQSYRAATVLRSKRAAPAYRAVMFRETNDRGQLILQIEADFKKHFIKFYNKQPEYDLETIKIITRTMKQTPAINTEELDLQDFSPENVLNNFIVPSAAPAAGGKTQRRQKRKQSLKKRKSARRTFV